MMSLWPGQAQVSMESWDLLDADLCPDIHTLFVTYNQQYFENLLGVCTVEWSDRMTLCAGLCYMKGNRKTLENRHCVIRLSRPLLQYRPFSDTINTLLHEMIHAYIFIKQGGTLDRDGHGPDFQAQMQRINGLAGSTITVFHTFHEEVRALKKHVWRCQGSCSKKAPFYGWVRRSMNRAPQPADWWWSQHQSSCGGTFLKVDEPLEFKKKEAKKKEKKVKSEYEQIDKYFGKMKGKGRKLGGEEPSSSTKRDEYEPSEPCCSTATEKSGKVACIDLTEDE